MAQPPASSREGLPVWIAEAEARQQGSRWRAGLYPRTHWFQRLLRASRRSRRPCSQAGRRAPEEAAGRVRAGLRRGRCSMRWGRWRRSGRPHPARPASHTRPRRGRRTGGRRGCHDRVDLAALIAGDDPRRHAGRAHHHHEGRREVFAEAPAGVEQETIHVVPPGGVEGVAQAAAPEVFGWPDRGCLPGLPGGAGAQLAAEFDAAGVAPGGGIERLTQHQAGLLVASDRRVGVGTPAQSAAAAPARGRGRKSLRCARRR